MVFRRRNNVVSVSVDIIKVGAKWDNIVVVVRAVWRCCVVVCFQLIFFVDSAVMGFAFYFVIGFVK